MMKQDDRNAIISGKTYLGIEFGSTRIKAVLIDGEGTPLSSGSHEWENRLENGIWTYSLEDIWEGLQDCYRDLKEDVEERYQTKLTTCGAIGISAMMHGYMAFDKEGKLLVPFRTWRNTITEEASDKLTELFHFHIPQRWSIAHLYQAILNGEEHVGQIDYIATLAGYVHWRLTGQAVLGIGDASGMFPIDSAVSDYSQTMLDQFDSLEEVSRFGWHIRDILPKVLCAGEEAGFLTEEGARLLDPEGTLQSGIALCPPEGDAGTGMAATNSVAVGTGNVSAGTSIFSMVVLDRDLSKVHPMIDMVTTPDGAPVAMVHCNNGTSDLNAWVGLFGEFAAEAGLKMEPDELYGLLYRKALEGDPDCGGLLSYGYFSGEHNVGMEEGRPLFVRKSENHFTLANFMRVHLFTSLGVLRLGAQILDEEGVPVKRITGHGGLFKTPVVGQQVLAACMNAPVYVMETAGEGGAWGIALLAAYLAEKTEEETLGSFLQERIFGGDLGTCVAPLESDVSGFAAFIRRYQDGLPIERAAIDSLK